VRTTVCDRQIKQIERCWFQYCWAQPLFRSDRLNLIRDKISIIMWVQHPRLLCKSRTNTWVRQTFDSRSIRPMKYRLPRYSVDAVDSISWTNAVVLVSRQSCNSDSSKYLLLFLLLHHPHQQLQTLDDRERRSLRNTYYRRRTEEWTDQNVWMQNFLVPGSVEFSKKSMSQVGYHDNYSTMRMRQKLSESHR